MTINVTNLRVANAALQAAIAADGDSTAMNIKSITHQLDSFLLNNTSNSQLPTAQPMRAETVSADIKTWLTAVAATIN
jgi:hypothetical protein